MGKKKRPSETFHTYSSGDPFQPKHLLTFVEASAFKQAWKRCGLSDDDLFRLQTEIMLNPTGAQVLDGTGGLRKLRFSPEGSGRGKSGSHRALYVYFEEFAVVLLVSVYPKSKRDNISAAGKKAAKEMIERQEELLRKRQRT